MNELNDACARKPVETAEEAVKVVSWAADSAREHSLHGVAYELELVGVYLASRDPEAAKLVKSGIENRMRWYAANEGDINREILALDCAEVADALAKLEEENAALKHDLERQMTIANIECNRAEEMRAALMECQDKLWMLHFSLTDKAEREAAIYACNMATTALEAANTPEQQT